MRRFSSATVLLCLLVVTLYQAPSTAIASEIESDLWYALEVAGEKAGWMHVVREVDGDRIHTRTETHMAVGRGIAATEISTTSVFTETLDGRPVEAFHTQIMSSQPVTTHWLFQDDAVRLTTTQGDSENTREVPLPDGVWLTPAAADRYSVERMEAGASIITCRVLDPEFGLDPVEATAIRVGKESYELHGETIEVTTWRSSIDKLPLESTDRIAEDGHLVQSTMETGVGVMTTRLVTKAEAMADAGGPGPDLLTATLVRADRPIPDPYRSTSATFRLRARDDNMPELPAVGAQQVNVEDDGAVLLTITTAVDASLPAEPDELDDPTYLESSSMIDAEDVLVKALTRSATRGIGDDPLKRADAMRAKVARHISKKSLKTAFASAAETARTRTGDCSEHGVLLCAMLRADGIPARVASGLTYADGFLGQRDVFGWHMWTQALIDGRWIDFDATLPTRYHAGHILTGTSALSDTTGSTDLAPMMMLMGNLDVEVVEVGHLTWD